MNRYRYRYFEPDFEEIDLSDELPQDLVKCENLCDTLWSCGFTAITATSVQHICNTPEAPSRSSDQPQHDVA